MSFEASNFGTGPYHNLHRDIEMRYSPIAGRGLFATAPIKADTVIWVNQPDGPMMTLYQPCKFNELGLLPELEQMYITRYGSQLDHDTIIGPRSEDETLLDNSNFFNHSCDPNTWPLNDNIWVLRRDVEAGEELTIDYITFDSNDYFKIECCRCGSNVCRRSLSPIDYKDPVLQERYAGHFVPFIQELISQH